MKPTDYMIVADISGMMRVIGARAMTDNERAAVEQILRSRFSTPDQVIPPAKTPMNPPKVTEMMTQGEIARAQGYTGNPCHHCGSLRMKMSGTCETCQDCGWNPGCG